jgi:hypothetical protein
MLTHAVGEYRVALLAAFAYKFFLLAQPALPASLRTAVADSLAAGAQQFTCFTGAKVQILPPRTACAAR